MGNKLTLNDVGNLQNESSVVTTLAQNNRAIETAIENTLSRDGLAPNMMQSNLDMNNYKIINIPDALTAQEPVSYSQFFSVVNGLQDGAVLDANYVVLGTSEGLLNARTLQGSANISITDQGPTNSVDVAISDDELNALAATTAAADTVPYYTGTTTASTTPLTSFGRSLIDDADATAARATIGLQNVDNTSDVTKNAAVSTLTNKTINLSSNTLSGTTAQFNAALSDNDFVTRAGTETLTNKTLTSPAITSPTGIVKGDVGLGNVDNTSDATKNSATVTLTNKTINADATSGGTNTLSLNAGSFVNASFGALANKATPTGSDILMIQDQAASGAMKRINVSTLMSGAAPVYYGMLFGLETANNATDTVNDIDINAGTCADSTTSVLMTLSAGVTRQLDVAFGTGNGGRFDTSISDGTWHVFVISNGTTVNVGFSKSLNPTGGANYPVGYTYYRRIWSIVRASTIIQYVQSGDFCNYYVPSKDINTASQSTSDVTYTLASVPTGISVLVQLGLYAFTTGAGTSLWVRSPFMTGAAVSITDNANFRDQSAGSGMVTDILIQTNTSAQVICRAAAAVTSFTGKVRGYFDGRGK